MTAALLANSRGRVTGVREVALRRTKATPGTDGRAVNQIAAKPLQRFALSAGWAATTVCAV